MKSRMVLALSISLMALFMQVPQAAAQTCGFDGNILDCINNCDTYCDKDESVEGWWACEATAREYLLSKCTCGANWHVFKNCITPKSNKLRTALRTLERFNLIEQGTAATLRLWVIEQVQTCKNS